MPLISEDYRSLNEELHDSNPSYGTSGKRHANSIRELAMMMGTRDILDYGCGKSTLQENLPFLIKQYDPARPKYSEKPEPAEIVVCTDVLEHIEPENLDDVLDDLKRVTKTVGYFTVATRPAVKTLSDGRNAHLIIEDYKWWLPKLWERFNITQFQEMEGKEFLIIVGAK